MFGKVESGTHDVFVEEADVVTVWVGWIVVVRQIPGQHGVEDDTTGPDIDGGPDV